MQPHRRPPEAPRRLRVLVAPAALALAVTAAPAAAQDGHALTLTGPGSARPGKAVTLQATGTVPAAVFLDRYLNVCALPAQVVASCPTTSQGALRIKDNPQAQGGETIALGVPAEGAFSTPIAYPPSIASRLLLCGYLHDLVDTYAVAAHVVDVRTRRRAPRRRAASWRRPSGAPGRGWCAAGACGPGPCAATPTSGAETAGAGPAPAPPGCGSPRACAGARCGAG